MPTYPAHVLVAFGGSLGNPPLEVWTNSLKLTANFGPVDYMTEEQQELMLPELVTPLSTWMNSADSFISNAASLDWIKVNSIATTGKYMYPQTTGSTLQTPILGGVSIGTSFRSTLALGMYALNARGRGGKGRIYPPAMQISPAPKSPYISDTDANKIAGSFLTLISAINAITLSDDTTWQVTNISAGNASQPAGYSRPVDHIVVDRVPDTQRRRTNRVPRLVVTSAQV